MSRLQSRVWSLTRLSTDGFRRVNGCSRSIGAGPEIVRRVSVACYEAEMNVVIHAHRGRLTARLEDGRLDVLHALLRALGPVERRVGDRQEPLRVGLVGERQRRPSVGERDDAGAAAQDHPRRVDVLADDDERAAGTLGHGVPFAKWSRSRKVFAQALVRRRRLSTITGGRSSIASSSP